MAADAAERLTEREAHRLGNVALMEEVQTLRELLCEATGLTLSGVQQLVALHRSAEGRAPRVQVEELSEETGAVYDVLTDVWTPTGMVVDQLVPREGRSDRARKVQRRMITAQLKFLVGQGLAESRRCERDDGQGGWMEWRRC